jgi:protein-S-isoprenylcysteine O-methyltransferase Ste14
MLIVFGLCFAGWAAWLFHRAGTGIPTWQPARRLVTRGPYAISRNPMYLGLTAAYAGLALALANAWALLLLGPVLIVMDRFVIAREEPYLEARFGQPYRDYLARVRRWL